MVIYRAISPSGKSYIGMTSNFEERKRKHFVESTKRVNHFYTAIKKYGFESFKWTILLRCGRSRKFAGLCERFFIWIYNTYKNGYNMTPGGDGAGLILSLIHI